MLQRLRRHSYWACAFEIDRILRRKCTPESRKADLDDILDGDSFAKTLVTFILGEKFGPHSAYARAFQEENEDTSMSAVEFLYQESDREKVQRLSAGFSFLSEHAMVDILWSDETTREALRVLLNLGEECKKTEAEKTALSEKDLLISGLFYNPDAETRLDGYHNKLSRRAKEAKITENEDLAAESDLSLELDGAFLGWYDFGWCGFGWRVMMAKPIKPSDLQHINWKTGSDLLPNVEITFYKQEIAHRQNDCDRMRRPRNKERAGLFKFDPAHPQHRETFKVTSTSHMSDFVIFCNGERRSEE
ncbi:hypothetical protein BGZ65_003778 [Modicella reniformis]|uniref:Uncharacterized protein n=1 Tax=Modicella reniformis TaxID=1440133 RepID=A0A9P6J5V3_9FUNG|nr:hypothetical protein BGZ65_003778 [Modicella reniformis]